MSNNYYMQAEQLANQNLQALVRSLPKGLLNGNQFINEVDQLYRDKSNEEREYMKSLAKAAQAQQHTLEAGLKAVTKEFLDAGYIPKFTYNKATETIDIGVAGAVGGKALTADEQGFLMPVAVGHGFNNMVAEDALSVAHGAAGNYLQNWSINFLEQGAEVLRRMNKANKTPKTNARRLYAGKAVAERNTLNTFMPVSVKGSTRGETIKQLETRVVNKARKEQAMRRVSYAPLIQAATDVKTAFFQRHRKDPEQKHLSNRQLAAALEGSVARYMYACQMDNYVGTHTAKAYGRALGFSDQDMQELDRHFGDVLKFKPAWQAMRDEGIQQETGAIEANFGYLLGAYGDDSRHSSQTTNSVKKIKTASQLRAAAPKFYRRLMAQNHNDGRRLTPSVIHGQNYLHSRVKKVPSGFYENPEQVVSGVAYITNDKLQEKLREIYKEEYITQRIKEAIKEQSMPGQKMSKQDRKRIAETVRNDESIKDAANQYIAELLLPALADDQSIIQESAARLMSLVEDKKTKLSHEQLELLRKEAKQKLGLNATENQIQNWFLNKLFGKKTFVEGSSILTGVKNWKDLLYGGQLSDVSIATQSINHFGDVNKLLGGLTNARTYGVVLNDKTWAKLLKKLGIGSFGGTQITNIREAKAFSANAIPGLVRGLLERAMISANFDNAPKAKDLIKELQNNKVLSQFFSANNGQLLFDNKAFNEYVSSVDNPQVLTQILDAFVNQGLYLQKDANNNYIPLGDVLVIADVLNRANDPMWNKPVKVTEKDRASLARAMAMGGYLSGTSDKEVGKVTQLLLKRLTPGQAGGHRDEEYTRALALKGAIDEAFVKTFKNGNGTLTEEQVQQYINSSYHSKLRTGADKASISIGSGTNYTINLDDFADVKAAYENGHLSETEFYKTLWGAIEQQKQAIAKATGIAVDQIPVFLDPMTSFGLADPYNQDKQITGRLFYLPNVGPDTQELYGETVYDLPFYSPEVMAVLKSIGNADVTSQNLAELTAGLWHSAYNSKGSVYEGLHKMRAYNSKSFRPKALDVSKLDPSFVKKYEADLVGSRGAIAQMLGDDSGFESEDDYLKNVANYIGLSRYQTKKLFKGLSSFQEKKQALIERGLEVASTTGLLGVFKRDPTIDAEALQSSRIYASDQLRGLEGIFIGPALQFLLKADFDGDKISAMLSILDGTATADDYKVLSQISEQQRAIAVDAYGRYQAQKSGSSGFSISAADLQNADSQKITELIAYATKQNKPFTGEFSLMHTRVKNALDEAGLSERSLSASSSQTDVLNVAKGILTAASLESLEQDAIDSKKVRERIGKLMQDPKFASLSTEQQNALVLQEIETEFLNLSNNLLSGNLSYADYIKQLDDIGIIKGGQWGGKVSSKATARIDALGKRAGIQDIWKLLGVTDEKAWKQGLVDASVLTATGTDVDSLLQAWSSGQDWAHGSRVGIFSSDTEINGKRFGINTRTRFSPGSGDNSYAMLKDMQDLGIRTRAAEDSAFGIEGEILAYQTHSIAAQLAKLSDVLANFVQIFETMGRGAVSQIHGFEWLNTNGSYGMTTYLNNLFPNDFPNANLKGLTDKYKNLSDADKQAFGEFNTDTERAKMLNMPLETYLQSKMQWKTVAEGKLYHGYLDKGDAYDTSDFTTEALMYGYSPEQIEKMWEQVQEGGKKLKEFQEQSGFKPENTLRELKIDTNALGGSFTDKYGKSLNEVLDYVSWDENGNIVISDTKTNKSGKLSPANVGQLVGYTDTIAKMRLDLQKNTGNLTDEQWIADLFGDAALKDPTLKAALLGFLGAARSNGRITTLGHGRSAEGIMKEFLIKPWMLSDEMHTKLGQGTPLTRDEQMVFEKIVEEQMARTQDSGVRSIFYNEEQQKEETRTVQEQTAAENAYVAALKQELNTRLKLEDVKRKQNLTTNRQELAALAEQQAALEKELAAREKITRARKREAGPLSKETKEEVMLAKLAHESSLAGVMGRNKGAHSIFDVLGNGIKRAFQNFFNFNIVHRAVRSVSSSFEKVVGLTKELDVAMMNLRVVSGQNADQAYDTMMAYNGLAKELGTTTKAVAESSNTWLRQGYSIRETQDLIKSSTYLAKLGMISQADATKDLTAVLKGFKMEATESMSIVDKLTELDKNYAASAGEIGEALSRVSAVAQQAGMSLDETAAAVTVIMDVTQQGAQMSGTALRTMLSRFSQVKAGSFASMVADDDDVENINDIEKVLNALGISLRKNNMEMRAWSDVLGDLNEKWITLSDVEKNAVATAFGGKIVPPSVLKTRNTHLIAGNALELFTTIKGKPLNEGFKTKRLAHLQRRP